MRKYNKALDLILASAAAFKQGKGAEAAAFMEKAAEDEDFGDAIDTMNDLNEDAMDEEEASVTTAAFTSAAKRLKVKADNMDVSPVSNENMGEGDLPSNAGSNGTDNTPELRGEKAVEARLARADRNTKRLAAR